MKNKPIRTVEDVLTTLRQERQMRVDAVVSGAPKSFDEYRHSVGAISGLGIAEHLLKDLLESQEDDLFDPPP